MFIPTLFSLLANAWPSVLTLLTLITASEPVYISNILVAPPNLIVELAKSYLIAKSNADDSERIFKFLFLNVISVAVNSSWLTPSTVNPRVSGVLLTNKPVPKELLKYIAGEAKVPLEFRFKNGVLTLFVPTKVILPLSSVIFPCPIVNAGSAGWGAVIVTKFPEALK